MRSENGKIAGVTTLSEDLDLSGVWSGNCTVTSGATLNLRGTITGDLTVDFESAATVDGTVGRNLRADGSVVVRGVVQGRASGDGLDVRSGARVGGQTI